MNDNAKRYRAVRKALNLSGSTPPPGNQARRLNTPAGLISGIAGSQKSCLPEIANKVPDGAKPESGVKQFSRRSQNKNVSAEAHFIPFASELLSGQIAFQGQGCSVLIKLYLESTKIDRFCINLNHFRIVQP
ncbi:hypothetical protein QUF90_13410 [Desulfococcaceae bacterium HSG9]|nr:hypothetical protein [Desulfococcaceae bacterium HSG9]